MHLLYILPLLLLLSPFVQSNYTITAYTNVDAGTYSKLVVAERPSSVAPTSIAIVGERLTPTQTDGAKAEATGFTMYSPPDVAYNSLGFYFGYFSGSAQFNLQAHNLTVQGSLLELIGNFLFIYAYQDRDSNPGFQYTLGNEIVCSLAPTGADCIDLASLQDLSTVSYGPISVTQLACPAGYNAQCSIYAFTISTTGANAGLATFTFKLASQPVYIDDYLITGDYGKIDVSINFPWSSYPLLTSSYKVGILTGVAGKTASLSATVSPISGKQAVQFTLNGKIGTFTWESTATVTTNKRSSSSTVYYDPISGEEIEAYQCTGTCLVNPIVPILKLLQLGWKAFGWKVSLIFFSWADSQPSNVYWDPTVGFDASPSGSPSVRLEVGWVMIVPAMLAYLSRWM